MTVIASEAKQSHCSSLIDEIASGSFGALATTQNHASRRLSGMAPLCSPGQTP